MKLRRVRLVILVVCLVYAVVSDKAVGQSSTGSSQTTSSYETLSILQNNSVRPPNQIRVAYCSASADYLAGAQTIMNSYQQAAQAASAQQLALDVQVMPFFLPNTFPFGFAASLINQLYEFQVDLIVGDYNWLVHSVAQSFGVPYLQLYSTFPDSVLATEIFIDFISGFYFHALTDPASQFAAIYQSLSGAAYFNNYYVYYEYDASSSVSYSFGPSNYYAYPSNYPNFQLPLITFNPYLPSLRIISINVTLILDSQLPNDLDMRFFDTMTTSSITKSAAVAVRIITIPINSDQEALDSIVRQVLKFTGPCVVYATQRVSVGLMNSINRVGAFTTSFSKPIYQWHFINLTGGYAYDSAFSDLINSPYMYHWEFYNMTLFPSSCPQVAACPSCSNKYNRILDCDLGAYLSSVLSSYSSELSSSCASPNACNGTFNKSSTLLKYLSQPMTDSYYVTGPMAFSSHGKRRGMMVNLYLGANARNANLKSSCSADLSTSQWTCINSLGNASSSRNYSNTMVNVLIAAFMGYPYYYLNHTTGKFDGFYVAFAALLAQQCGFVNYTIYGVGKAGAFDSTSGNWSGVIGAVLGPADIGMTPTTKISNLTQSLAFSNPYVQVQFSALQQIANPSVAFSYYFYLIFRPFSGYNWLIQVLSIVAVAVLMLMIDYFSPNLVAFNVRRSWFYVLARSVMGAGGQNPDVFSSQVLMLVWSFVTMISISTYTANLTALSIDEEQSSEYISSFSDLASASGQWTPCCISGSFAANYFMSSIVDLEATLWRKMSQCMFASQSEAFATIRNWSNPAASNMVLIVLQPSALYASNTYENLMITANYSAVNLVLMVPKGLQANVPVSVINSAIQSLTTTGALTSIVNAYLKLPYKNFPDDAWTLFSNFFNEQNFATQFTFENLCGLFMIMLAGMAVSIAIAGLERWVAILWDSYLAKKQRRLQILVNNLHDSLEPKDS